MTSWNDFLAGEGAIFDDPASIRFADAHAEAALAAEATLLCPLPHLAALRASGADAGSFLQNLLSNEVQQLAADAAVWNSFNTAKGRMIASLLLWPESAEDFVLVAAADLAAVLHKRLSMYILRSKVKLATLDDETVFLGLSGNDGRQILQRSGVKLPDTAMTQVEHDGVRCVSIHDKLFLLAASSAAAAPLFARLQQAGAVKAGNDCWQLAMIRAGLPLVSAATQEEFVAQMLNFELIGGVSFKKGCYPGQEIVARSHYLGKVKRRMYRLALPAGSAPARGDEIFAPDTGAQSTGKLVNVAAAAEGAFEALAVLRSSSAEAGILHLRSTDGPALQVLDLPYALP